MIYKHCKSSTLLRGTAAVNKTVLSTTNHWADGLSMSATVADINCLWTVQIKVTLKQVIGPYFKIMNKAVGIIEIRYRNTK